MPLPRLPRSFGALALGIGASLVPIGVRQGRASEIGQEHDAWVFGGKEFRLGLEPLPGTLRLDQEQGILEFWQRSRREGPRLGQLVAKKLGGAHLGRGDVGTSSFLSSLGFCGGAAARERLEERFGRRGGSRGPESFVIACIAYGRPRVAGTCERLRSALGRRQLEVVESLGAGLARLAVAARRGEARCAELGAPAELQPLLLAMQVALAPELEKNADWSPEPFPTEAPPPGSLAELLLRARLLGLSARPELTSRAALEALLPQGGRVASLASFVLGRLDGDARAQPGSNSGLDLAAYLCAVRQVPDELRGRLRRGADPVRPDAWRARYWAAAMRLLEARDRDTLAELLLERETQNSRTETCEAALLEWVRLRLTDETVTEELAPSLRDRLGRIAPLLPPTLGFVLRRLVGQEAEKIAVDPRFRATVERFLSGGFDMSRRRAGVLVWNRILESSWVRPAGGFAGPRAFVLEESNRLVHDLLVRGAEAFRQHWPKRDQAPYVPAGVPALRDDYFRLLDLLLRNYPLFQY